MDPLTPELWRRVKSLASEALERDEPARRQYVEEACADDPRLRAEVLSLLDSAVAAEAYFETPGGGLTAALFAAGSRIGPYRLIRELASGGMGSVYLAERADEFQQRAAIKIVRGGFANAFLLQRFREERQILASLEHPNIARLLDGGTIDTGLPYVVMEYVEGEPIDTFCESRGLPLTARLAVFREVCAAVHYAHQRLVIHRDIKPANILVTAAGVPKLLDFGIAKLLDPATGLELPAHTTLRVMTPESASPEQVSGQPVTITADVYALGVLLYRLITGRSPYRVSTQRDTELARAICEQVPERPGAVVPGVPFDVDMIVMKALRKEPERRYGSVEQLSEDIQRFLERRPVHALPDAIGYRVRKFVSRHRVAMAAAAAVVLALIAGVAATVWQARVAERERTRAERQFNAVKGLAGAVLGELHDAVQKLPGSTQAREILLRRGTEYLDALAREAQHDLALRREVAAGYLRLATVQGTVGLPNLGDVRTTRESYGKAIALLEPIAAADRGEVEDRLNLATGLVRLAQSDEDAAAKDERLKRARAIVDALKPGERETVHALTVRQALWTVIANVYVYRRDYAQARPAYEEIRRVAESALAQSPDNLDASRNLSLAYKQLGAVLEMLDDTPPAMELYEKALELDRRRVAAEPWRSIWRLDLSFAHGAMGAALLAQKDLRGALSRYEEAVRLREAVVAEDPSEDFAKLALARGYERLGTIHGRMGNASAAVDYSVRRAHVYHGRLTAHPERANFWKDYVEAAFAAVKAGHEAIVSSPGTRPEQRRALASKLTAILDRIDAAQREWERSGRGPALPPAPADLAQVRDGLASVSRTPVSR